MDYKFVTKHFAQKTYEQMKDVLMNPDGDAPAIFYYMVRGGRNQKNITVWESGTVGGEYIKTYGHYHLGRTKESYQILFGEGVVLLQKPTLDANGNIIPDEVAEFKVIKVKPGDSVLMPSGWGHVIVNIAKTAFVTADDTDVVFDESLPPKTTGGTDYETIKKMQGFAYYVVVKDGNPVLIKNQKYKSVLSSDFGGLNLAD